jgi:hypothetical protein
MGSCSRKHEAFMSVEQLALTFFALSVVAFALGGMAGRLWQFDAWKPALSVGLALQLGVGGSIVSYVSSGAIDIATQKASTGAPFQVIVPVNAVLLFGLATSCVGALIVGIAWRQTLRLSRRAWQQGGAAGTEEPPARAGEVGRCPNCTQAIPASSPECPHCKALFGAGSAWKIGRGSG